MYRPVNRKSPGISTRLAFLLFFTLYYWSIHFISGKSNLQLSQIVFDIFAGVFTGAVTHVAIAKFFGPLLFGRGFCGWVCWNASVFEMLPIRNARKGIAEKRLIYKYVVLIIALVIPGFLIAAGYIIRSPKAQFEWLLIENALIYLIGIILALVLGDRRAFCKYLCPAGALMTLTSPRSILKIEKNHLTCSNCRRCEEVCPMDVPILDYIKEGQRVSHPECILCTECVNSCPRNCLTVGIGKKSDTTPEFGKSF
ncbi:4Fe-4S binding protein [Phosphitispora sp. TUW77]|uniref:4Fe-4S binding protein n=1 Tax=Phosphitispora sp. TUW77 TaxID=3152361 RepID=UPI003AB149DE